MLEKMKQEIKNCRDCETLFGFRPNPVVWGNEYSKIVQISQAPSLKVHESGKPFTDMSGKTLKYEWYQISEDDFYNEDNFYIAAMAHCYPGKDKHGNDRQPPKQCFEKWVEKEIKLVHNEIYIVIGAKAAASFFPDQPFERLVFENQIWNNKLTFVLPHPSPLNRRWIKSHPEFTEKRLPEIRGIIHQIINKTESKLES